MHTVRLPLQFKLFERFSSDTILNITWRKAPANISSDSNLQGEKRIKSLLETKKFKNWNIITMFLFIFHCQ